jgi:hypothetical protein
MKNDSNDNLLEAWNDDVDVTAAKFVVLVDRVSKMIYYF